MYHSISNTPEDGVSPYYRTCTSPEAFENQISFLARNGYTTPNLIEAGEQLESGGDHSKSVVITFDDGFRDFYTQAFPVLRRYGFSATMFLPTAYIDGQRRSFKDRECLTWSEVCELREAGMLFGSHTVSHPKLVKLSPSEIRRELSESKAELERRLGEPILTFAYPFAFPQANREFSESFRRALVEAGYKVCVTTEIGCIRNGDDPLHWKRLPANTCDDLSLLEAKLAGAYDWLSVPQTAVKRLKSLFRPGLNA
jgi:peptidoglycan/xylan/chitin deacetylase (PgdA/CDA1 family)